MIFKMRFRVLGEHVHCRLFSAPRIDTTFAMCGTIVVRRGEEFQALLGAFSGATFINDDGRVGLEAARTL